MEFEITLLLYINSFCYRNYFMDSENKAVREKADDFITLKTFKIQRQDIQMNKVTIKDKVYVGLQRKCYIESLSDPKTKSIYLLVEAWATLQTQSAPSIEKGIKEHKLTPTAWTESIKGKKRAYNDGMI